MDIDQIKDTLDILLRIPDELKKATGFSVEGEYVRIGPACDSSDYAELRFSFVEAAYKEFLSSHTKEILNRAAELAEEEIKELKQSFSEIKITKKSQNSKK